MPKVIEPVDTGFYRFEAGPVVQLPLRCVDCDIDLSDTDAVTVRGRTERGFAWEGESRVCPVTGYVEYLEGLAQGFLEAECTHCLAILREIA